MCYDLQKAEHALKFYKGYKGENKAEDDAIYRELERLKSIASRKKEEAKFQVSDLCELIVNFYISERNTV